MQFVFYFAINCFYVNYLPLRRYIPFAGMLLLRLSAFSFFAQPDDRSLAAVVCARSDSFEYAPTRLLMSDGGITVQK